MRFLNETKKTIKICITAEGWDPREDVLKPGEMSDWWVHMDTDDVIVIRENEGENE